MKILETVIDNEGLKRATDEIIWQVAYVECIEGLFNFMESYEKEKNVQVTHFAIKHDYKFGLESIFDTESKAESGLLTAEASSEAQAGARYTIHLSGIIATTQKVIR